MFPLRLGTNGTFLLRFPSLLPEPDGEVTTGIGSGDFFPVLAAWSADFTSDLAVGAVPEDSATSSLGFLVGLSGVCERDDPGLERGDRLRVDGFF